MDRPGPRLAAVLLFAVAAPGCASLGPPPVSLEATASCTAEEGFPELYRELQQAVATRDGKALRALFHSAGRMRVDGIGGDASSPDWRFSGASAEAMWADLRQVLELGCARVGDRLLLPALAIHARRGASTEAVVALEPLSLRSGPAMNREIALSVAKGRLLVLSIPEIQPGWSELLVGGRKLYAPSALLRSPYGTQIEIAREGGRWRIMLIGSGI